MIDEIFEVMKNFNGSYINQCGELILSDRGNVYFTATNCKTKEDVICKLLEWCSRPIAKGVPYATNKRNIEWRNSLLCGYNNYLGTNFTQDDMYWIYDKLGNAVNHELALKFIHSNYDLSLVRPHKETEIKNIDHWIEEETYLECPKCGDVWFYEQNQTAFFKFCPNCGASNGKRGTE